jgi:hypothetical protein
MEAIFFHTPQLSLSNSDCIACTQSQLFEHRSQRASLIQVFQTYMHDGRDELEDPKFVSQRYSPFLVSIEVLSKLNISEQHLSAR